MELAGADMTLLPRCQRQGDRGFLEGVWKKPVDAYMVQAKAISLHSIVRNELRPQQETHSEAEMGVTTANNGIRESVQEVAEKLHGEMLRFAVRR